MTRTVAGKLVNPIGLGCMNLSHAYGVPPSPEVGLRVLHKAIDLGVDHFDTAALYAFGKNETLVGEALKGHRDKVFLASKCGMTGIDGKRVIDGRPETLKATCEAALKRLQTEVIDLYYLHRWDKTIPVEESMGAMADLVAAGKIKAVGLSEVSAVTLCKAHAVHPIAAVQTEYSLWTRNAEIAVMAACADIGAAFVAFSPLGRGFLGGEVTDTQFAPGDVRTAMARFRSPQFEANLELLNGLKNLAALAGVTPAQLSLAWVLAQGEHVHVIPGTTSEAHLAENIAMPKIAAEFLKAAGNLINQSTVHGVRYPPSVQSEIDTEEF